jgi:hypothetical protein
VAAVRALEHPAIERDVPSLVMAYSTFAPVAVERGSLGSARCHAEKGEGGGGSDRYEPQLAWGQRVFGFGGLLGAEGSLVEAEHELAAAERSFADEVATVHHTWLLVALAGVGATRASGRGRGDAAFRTRGAR